MRPTPGQPYTTQQGDTPDSISTAAYGDPNEYPRLQDQNRLQTALTFGVVIPTGTVLIIPLNTDLESIRKRQLRRGLGVIND